MEIYYPGLPRGFTATHADLVNRDLLAFCQQGERKVAQIFNRTPLRLLRA